MTTPRVSVIVPTFNRAATLSRAVHSVLEQSFRDLEVIVVDDASTDDSARVFTELSRDARVTVVHHEANRGAAAARNTGLARARGNLIAFQDSDDRWRPGALARLVAAIDGAGSTIGVCYGTIARQTRFGVQLVPAPRTQPPQGDLSSVLLAGNVIDLPATVIRRQVFDAAGTFDPELRTLEDWELLLRISQVSRFRFVGAVLVDSAYTPGGVNSLSPHTLHALERIEQRHAERFASSREARAQLAYLRGCTHAALGDRRAMREQLRQAVELAPKRKYRLASAASRFGSGALDTTLTAAKVATGFGTRAPRTAEPAPDAASFPSLSPARLERLTGTISVVVPTRNAGGNAHRLIAALRSQTLAPSEIIAIDSSSTDGTAARFAAVGAKLLSLEPERFRHGAARNQAAGEASGDILVFMTQDVVPEPTCLEQLVAPLVSGRAAASYARQVADAQASPLERFARSRHYPAVDFVVEPGSADDRSVRSYFFSNACSAVRADVFWHLGGFPEHVIMNEDMNFAARLLRSGQRIAYRSAAVVGHTHRHSLMATFRRYFDIGVALEQSDPELRDAATVGEGLSFVRDLLTHLMREGRSVLIPLAVAESGCKWLGHFLGRRHRNLPPAVRRRLSLHRAYWGTTGTI